MLKQYIGDRGFYRNVFGIAIPIIIQNGITNFVSLLDNIMVGQVGTIPMSGVSIVNGLLFVFNICIFGASSGAGIFTAQYYGSQDHEGIRYTFRFKIFICTLISLLGAALFLFRDELLIGLYLTGEGTAADAAGAMAYGKTYLRVMLFGLLPFGLSNAYSGTLRETGETFVPMTAGIAAVMVNLVGNYILIFGHFGAPALGVEGAAWATVLSRYVELFIVAWWTHRHKNRNRFIVGVYRSCRIPGRLLTDIILKGMPLLVNEFLWATGMAVLNQCYSTCGLDVVPATNISSTLYNVGSVVYLALGSAVGIIMGQMLGAGIRKEAILENNQKLLATATVVGGGFGFLMAAVSVWFPAIYNTTASVRQLATALILLNAAILPFNSYTNAVYFTLRSGGETMVTFLFDSCFVWGFCVPLAYILTRYVGIGIIPLFAICQATDIIKCVLGGLMVKQGKWVQNLTK